MFLWLMNTLNAITKYILLCSKCEQNTWWYTFQLNPNPFWWEQYDNRAELVTVPLLPPPSPSHCMHACCRFSMFHHIIYIISFHTLSYLPISAISFTCYGWFVRSSSFAIANENENKNLYYTPQTPYIDSCMNFAVSTTLPYWVQ